MNVNNNEMLPEKKEPQKYSKTTKSKKSDKVVRFNFVDAILIVMIAATILAVVAYFLPGIASYFTNREEADVTFVIEFSGVDGDLALNIKPEDAVYDASQNHEIGKVVSVEKVSHKVLVYNDNEGMAVYREHPELKNIIVTVKGSAIYTAGEGYYINGQRIAVGKQFNVRFPEFAGKGYCIDIIDEEQ